LVLTVSQWGFESLMLPFGHLRFLPQWPGSYTITPVYITCLEVHQTRESSPSHFQKSNVRFTPLKKQMRNAAASSAQSLDKVNTDIVHSLPVFLYH
jgi:hypothetical protein